MRTLLIIAAGFALWLATLGIARLLTGSAAASSWTPTAIFAVLWLLLAAGNMYVGVSRAGYSVREELPIFLLVFLVPVAAAVLVKWRAT